MPKSKKKKNTKVRDLKPKKDAKGGGPALSGGNLSGGNLSGGNLSGSNRGGNLFGAGNH